MAGDADGERIVYEKILAAHEAARAEPRLRPDDFLRVLLSAAEMRSDAYLVFEYLQGRSAAFREFLRREFGYVGDGEAAASLQAKYPAIAERLQRYRSSGR
jgi:hypothetical protein